MSFKTLSRCMYVISSYHWSIIKLCVPTQNSRVFALHIIPIIKMLKDLNILVHKSFFHNVVIHDVVSLTKLLITYKINWLVLQTKTQTKTGLLTFIKFVKFWKTSLSISQWSLPRNPITISLVANKCLYYT